MDMQEGEESLEGITTGGVAGKAWKNSLTTISSKDKHSKLCKIHISTLSQSLLIKKLELISTKIHSTNLKISSKTQFTQTTTVTTATNPKTTFILTLSRISHFTTTTSLLNTNTKATDNPITQTTKKITISGEAIPRLAEISKITKIHFTKIKLAVNKVQSVVDQVLLKISSTITSQKDKLLKIDQKHRKTAAVKDLHIMKFKILKMFLKAMLTLA